MDNNEYVHIGARPLDPNVVIKTLPGIDNLETTINNFRTAAYIYRMKNRDNDKIISKEQYDNVISVLGNRGIGKTSTLLTIMKEIQNNRYFNLDKEENINRIDIFSPLIAPEDMSENSDILGWIIVVLQNVYAEMKSTINNQHTFGFDNLEKTTNEIEKCFYNLKRAYQYRKPESNKIVNDNYSTLTDYAFRKIEIEKDDFELVKLFQKTIDNILDLKSIIIRNQFFSNSEPKEPLFFFFFDDVDVVTRHSVNILKDIVSFLSHPNIVVIISGDYKVFSQSATVNMLAEEGIHHGEIDQSYIYGSENKFDSAMNLAKSRSEFFLRKVLPPIYRYELKPLNNEDKAQMSYGIQVNITRTIDELISDIFLSECSDKKDNFLYISNEEFFFNNDIDQAYRDRFISYYGKYINVNNEDELREHVLSKYNKPKYYVVYPYLSIFSSSARGFMNVYNYLYNQSKLKDKQWTLRDLSNFLEVIINSKSTFLRYRNEINKFLRIKNVSSDGNLDPTDLIIDCEELRIFILGLKSPINRTQLLDYESLIMLPIFFNELGNIVLGKNHNYEARYESVKYKLKEIFLNQYMKKINSNLELFPRDRSLKLILSFYHRITTRISLEALKYIISDSNIIQTDKENFNIRNDKKYFIQLFRCYLYFYEVIYFEDQKNNIYIYDGSNLVNINDFSSYPRYSDDQNEKKDSYNSNDNGIELKLLTEENYRNAIVSDVNLREKYEKILYMYCWLKFKTNRNWLLYLKRHALHCMNAINDDTVNGNVYPFSHFYLQNIFYIIDQLKKYESKTDQIANLEHYIKKISSVLDIQIIFDANKLVCLYKYFIKSLNVLFKSYNDPVKDDEKNKYIIENNELDDLLTELNYNHNEDFDIVFQSVNEFIALFEKKIKNELTNFDDLLKNSSILDKEDIYQRKAQIVACCSIINEVCINLFERINQKVSYDFDLYDIVSEIVLVVNRYVNVLISSDVENLILTNISNILDSYSDVRSEQFLDNLMQRLVQEGNIDKDKVEACRNDITRIILRETRFSRAMNFGIDENKQMEIIDLVISILPIYIISIYLKTAFIDINVKRDHLFFYNIYKISCYYE